MKRIVILLGMLLSLSATAWSQTRIGFVVGVERYNKSGLNDLDFAEDDARDVKQALDRLGFTTTGVIGGDASLTNLNTELDRFITETEKLNKSDIAVLYFSGHGVQKLVQRRTADGRTIEVEEPFFCPNDAIKTNVGSLLSLNTLLKRLEESSGSDHNIIMLDACRDSADKSGKGGIDGSTIRELSDKLALFFAAKSGHRSYESKQLGHGIFTHYLLEGLRGQAADSDNEITLQGLTNYVSKQVERSSPEMLAVSPVDAQRPNLMGNLSGTIVLGRVSSSKPQLVTEFSNSSGMTLKLIPAGEFLTGSTETKEELKSIGLDPGDYDVSDEKPQHRVQITQPFFMGVHEVTLGQFLEYYNADRVNHKTDAEKDGKGGYGYDSKTKEYGQKAEYVAWNTGWNKPVENYMDHPVVNVSWNEAVSFCEWLTRRERSAGRISKDQRYRLPTEAEWEYACRGGSKVSTMFSFGDEVDDLVRYGNVGDLTALKYFGSENWGNNHPKEDGAIFTSRVGSYPPNGFGLYDIHGNVWEWCSDWYGEYPSEAVKDPTGPNNGSDRVGRGGSWGNMAAGCRSAIRIRNTPDYRSDSVGFRVALGR